MSINITHFNDATNFTQYLVNFNMQMSIDFSDFFNLLSKDGLWLIQ